MSRVAVLTAIYDQYDTLKPAMPQSGIQVEWICVTDSVPEGSHGWTIVHEPRPGVHPNRAAKRPKFLPWKYTDTRASLWIDASFRVLSPDFVLEALEYANPIAQFAHPWRDCLYKEADAVLGLKKYHPFSEVAAQSQAYREAGHPENWGLWATGVIARQHTPEIKSLGEQWMNEVNRNTFQDQISQPYVLRELGLKPQVFPGTHFANPWVSYEGSARH